MEPRRLPAAAHPLIGDKQVNRAGTRAKPREVMGGPKLFERPLVGDALAHVRKRAGFGGPARKRGKRVRRGEKPQGLAGRAVADKCVHRAPLSPQNLTPTFCYRERDHSNRGFIGEKQNRKSGCEVFGKVILANAAESRAAGAPRAAGGVQTRRFRSLQARRERGTAASCGNAANVARPRATEGAANANCPARSKPAASEGAASREDTATRCPPQMRANQNAATPQAARSPREAAIRGGAAIPGSGPRARGGRRTGARPRPGHARSRRGRRPRWRGPH